MLKPLKAVRIFLTGVPGVGKSRVFEEVVALLRKQGLRVGGFSTPEVRGAAGQRTGFKALDIATSKEGWLAATTQPGKRFGKYYVKTSEFEEVALPALDFALKECDAIGVDELGRMEFFSEKFREKMKEVLASKKPLLATLHRTLVREYAEHGKVVEVTAENRGRLPEEIASEFLR